MDYQESIVGLQLCGHMVLVLKLRRVAFQQDRYDDADVDEI